MTFTIMGLRPRVTEALFEGHVKMQDGTLFCGVGVMGYIHKIARNDLWMKDEGQKLTEAILLSEGPHAPSIKVTD